MFKLEEAKADKDAECTQKMIDYLKQMLQFEPHPSLEAIIDSLETNKNLKGLPFIGKKIYSVLSGEKMERLE